ncbi:hypothetical protein QWY93_11100 [Echinicola jeungdonensis]|uniref:tRNA (Guanine-N1)-methyltransferase n=1 Tax=Echinicola jeungdonensis TaxID=709343 RepID=A0ABV5J8R0_9BACT|nr:hypothetical protein [Echinicola jeungdonensis]MDN3669871.1 hypothetical protein [Echinicola jeungdonensis]
MRKISVIAFFTFLIACSVSFGQNATEEAQPANSLNSGTIESQFDYLNNISNDYQEYKVVKKNHLERLKGHVLDSLRVFKEEIIQKNGQIKEQQASIDELNTGIQNTEQKLQEALEIKDSFSFLGMNIHKGTYTTMMWGLVAGLSITLLYFIYRYSKSFKVIAETQKTLSETREEFDQHRKNTLERERKLKRQLVDATNNNPDLNT